MQTKKIITKNELTVLLVGLVLLTAITFSMDTNSFKTMAQSFNNSQESILPTGDVILPIIWGNLGKQMTETGVIDKDKFEQLYAQRGGLNEETIKLINNEDNGALIINKENSGVLLNLLWAFGLSNKNQILETGPMVDPRYGGAGNFASTGGWGLAVGNPMDHYSQNSFIILTAEQQKLVEQVSKNIYRPCCGNSTHFPDCNHGMAMLGLLELMASQGVGEEEMYRVALQVNSYWFPGVYETINQYIIEKDLVGKIKPKDILGEAYSSGTGYQRILKEITPTTTSGGGGCSI